MCANGGGGHAGILVAVTASASIVRVSTPADAGALTALLAGAFEVSTAAPFLDASLMRWKYWDTREDWEEPRSLVMEKDGRLAAHVGLWPLTWRRDGVVLRGVHMIDWAASREAPGAGVALLQRVVRQFDFVFSIGGSDITRKVLPSFGFKVAGEAWRAARPLHPVTQALTHQQRSWKLLPRLGRNLVWARFPAPAIPAGWRAAPLTQSAQLAFPCGDGPFGHRPLGFLEYLRRCPAASIESYGIANPAGGVAGCFTLCTVQRQARIAGVWLREPSAEHLRIAYQLARREALAGGGEAAAAELLASGSDEASREAARLAGFHKFAGTPVYLYDKPGRLSGAHLQFQLADNDIMFLTDGHPNYHT